MLVKMSELIGGTGGREFVTHLHTHGEQITEIHIAAGDFVDALQLVFTNALGQPDSLPVIGGSGGERFVFALDENEYLVGISGRYGTYLDQIQFHTNKRNSPTYGGRGGQQFSLYADDGYEVAGLFGRAGWYIDSIGIATRPLVQPEITPSVSQRANSAVNAALGYVQGKVVEAQTKTAEVIAKATGEVNLKELQAVEGIGPKISQVLADHGVHNLATLAQTQVERLQEILSEAGARYKLADPATWPEQAKIGVSDGMKALKGFQKSLKGGRKSD